MSDRLRGDRTRGSFEGGGQCSRNRRAIHRRLVGCRTTARGVLSPNPLRREKLRQFPSLCGAHSAASDRGGGACWVSGAWAPPGVHARTPLLDRLSHRNHSAHAGVGGWVFGSSGSVRDNVGGRRRHCFKGEYSKSDTREAVLSISISKYIYIYTCARAFSIEYAFHIYLIVIVCHI